MNAQRRNASGTTLLELLIVMFLFNILLASIYTLYKVSVDSWDVGLSRMTRISGSRGALQKMAWELGTAKIQTFIPPFVNQPLTTQSLQFVNDNNETIKFYNKIYTQDQPLRVISRMMRANISKGENPDEGKGSPLGDGKMEFTLMPGGLVQVSVTPDDNGKPYETTLFPRN